MPFGNIVAQGVTYEPRSVGKYTRSTVAFGQPDDSFIIRGANALSGADVLRASASRVLQKDITLAGNTVRKTMTFTGSIVVPTVGFTASEVDYLAMDIAEFFTVNTVTRMLMGDS